MEDYEIAERLKALRAEIRDLDDEVEKLRRKKANGEDVEEIAKKVSDIETEMRAKFNSLQSANAELLEVIRKLVISVDGIRAEMTTVKETNKGPIWQRIPVWSWGLMAIGLFAILQLGLERFAELKGVIR